MLVKKWSKSLAKLAPGKYMTFPKGTKNGLVVGFNHPSLGEIGRIMMMKADIMGDSMMLFPVNLPWYEALAPFYDDIKKYSGLLLLLPLHLRLGLK